MSAFFITTIVRVSFLTPTYNSNAEWVNNQYDNTTWGIKNTEINTWTKQSNTWVTTIVNEPTITTNNWANQWDQETSEGWTKLVLDCDSIVLHNDVATEIAIYMCKRNPDKDMLATFMQESWFNPNARWAAWEYGICQMMPNSTNLVWINDDRWNTRQRQADRCVDKWLAVPKKWVIWMAYSSNAYKKYLYLFK